MAYDKGMITKPVSIADVQKCVPVLLKRTNTSTGQVERRSSCDLGVLCSAQTGNQVTARDGKGTWTVESRVEINKWAWYKPIDFTKVGMLTESDRQTKYYGLFFRENTDAESLLKSTSPTVDLFNAAAASSYEWSYIPPKGGAASPYRLTDFVGETNNMGYKHDTKPPFEIYKNWGLSYSTLNNVANTYSIVTTGNNYEWSLKIYSDYTNATTKEIYAGCLFTGYKMKYNTQPQYDINGPDSLAIPMTKLLAKDPDNNYNINLNGANWRIGMIVYVPSSTFGLFVCKKTIKASLSGVNGENVRDLSVEMCTNQELALAMYRYMSGKTEYTFRALPVLIKDVKIGQSSKQSATDIARTYVNILSSPDTKIYPLPTGSVEIGITVTNDQGGDAQPISNGFTLETKYQSSTSTTTWGYHNINVITVTTTTAITAKKTVQLDFDYADLEGTYTYNGSFEIPAGSSFVLNGVSYYGKIFSYNGKSGGLEMRIEKIRKFIVS